MTKNEQVQWIIHYLTFAGFEFGLCLNRSMNSPFKWLKWDILTHSYCKFREFDQTKPWGRGSLKQLQVFFSWCELNRNILLSNINVISSKQTICRWIERTIDNSVWNCRSKHNSTQQWRIQYITTVTKI